MNAFAETIALDTLTLNGSAIISASILQLTNTTSQTGSAFTPAPYTLGPADRFEVFFAYQMTHTERSPIGDGFVFIAQNTPMGPNYLAEAGPGLGFFTQTKTPALGVAFYSTRDPLSLGEPGEVDIVHPNFKTLAGDTPTPSIITSRVGAAALRYVWVDYDNSTKLIAVYYSATSEKPANPIEYSTGVDLSTAFGGQVYFGFSAGTDATNSSLQSIDYLKISVVNQ